jgi:hypothetical protein
MEAVYCGFLFPMGIYNSKIISTNTATFWRLLDYVMKMTTKVRKSNQTGGLFYEIEIVCLERVSIAGSTSISLSMLDVRAK